LLSAQLAHYHFRHLTTSEGLSDGKINSIGQDKYGFIWIATLYGLNQYNGYSVEVFNSEKNDSTTLPNMLVRNQLTSTAGNVYFTSLGGLSRYDYVHRQFERHPFGIQKSVYSIWEPQPGILWMSGSDGLMTVEESSGKVTLLKNHPDTVISNLASQAVLDLAYTIKGLVYVATSTGLYELNSKTWTVRHFKHDDQDPNSICSNDVRRLAIDHDGKIWIAVDYFGSKLTVFDPARNTFRVYNQFYTGQKDWVDNRIMDLLVDHGNRIWIASLRAGIALYDTASDDFHFYMHDPVDPSSVSSNSVISLFEDKDGAIWAGTDGYGVDYFLPDHDYFMTIGVSSKSIRTLLDPSCRAIATDGKGNYWIGTYKGLSRYNSVANQYDNFLLTKAENNETNNSVRGLLLDQDGIVWAGTGGGLYRFNPLTNRHIPFTVTDSFPIVFTSYLLQDRKKNIWICTSRGLYIYKKTNKHFSLVFTGVKNANYRNENISTAWEDAKERIWCSVPRKGLLIYDPQQDTSRLFEFSYLNPNMQVNDYFSSIAGDQQGLIWLSSYSGLISFDPDHLIIKRYTEHDGLPSGKVSGLLVDSLNRIWMGTGRGICVLDTDRHTFHAFDMHDGLPTNAIYEGNAYALPDGKFAYPTYNGVVLFYPADILPKHNHIPLQLTQFTIAGAVPFFESAIQDLNHVVLRYNENFFTLEMTGLNYENPFKINYAYILEGFDMEWHFSKERRVNYTNVPGGTYTFRYKAVESPMGKEEAEKTLVIEIGTVFYKTWWFILLSGILLASLIYAFIRWRFLEQSRIHALENKAQLLEKEKALVMYENLKQHLNPHFLFNSLASLKSLIRVDQKNAGEFLERMSKIYRYILKSRENELVSLKEELAFAQTYITLQQARFRQGLQVTIKVDESFDHFRIVPVTLQNLIENAIKHNFTDEDTPLVIEIFVEGNYLVVMNNLQKKEFVETSNKQGLINMRALYTYLDSRPMQIIENRDSFVVKIPLI